MADVDDASFWICSGKEGLVVAFAVVVESAVEAYTADEALSRRNKDTARGSTFMENAILMWGNGVLMLLTYTGATNFMGLLFTLADVVLQWTVY